MTALFVEQDSERTLVVRHLRFACEQAEWNVPQHRRAAIARAMDRARDALAKEDLEFQGPAPAVLYRSPVTGHVAFANVQADPKGPPRWILPEGTPMLEAPANLGLYIVQGTTYANWAEGPLYHLQFSAPAVPTRLDRDTEALRATNSALREVIDRALSPAASALVPQDARVGAAQGLIDFRIKAIYAKPAARILDSRQGTGAAKLLSRSGEQIDLNEEFPA